MFISQIFFVPKKLQGWHLILNLNNFNTNLRKIHFKMETLEHICFFVRKNDYMCSVDLSDIYYSLPIHIDSCQKLYFKVDNTLFHFTCLPNGYHNAPRLFTKILKVPLATLYTEGTNVIMYLDDS